MCIKEIPMEAADSFRGIPQLLNGSLTQRSTTSNGRNCKLLWNLNVVIKVSSTVFNGGSSSSSLLPGVYSAQNRQALDKCSLLSPVCRQEIGWRANPPSEYCSRRASDGRGNKQALGD